MCGHNRALLRATKLVWPCLLLMGAAGNVVQAQQGSDLDLSWATVGYGAQEPASGEGLELLAAIGQPDASAQLAGGDFQLAGGFFCRFSRDFVFADGFESGDTSAWSEPAEGSPPAASVDEKPSAEQQRDGRASIQKQWLGNNKEVSK